MAEYLAQHPLAKSVTISVGPVPNVNLACTEAMYKKFTIPDVARVRRQLQEEQAAMAPHAPKKRKKRSRHKRKEPRQEPRSDGTRATNARTGSGELA
jgi:hypothetical protein